MTDPRKPMTPKEVSDLLKATLHGPLPQETVYRMMATLAEWMGLAEQLEELQKRLAVVNQQHGFAEASLLLKNEELAANAQMLAQQTDLARQAENERDAALARLKKLDEAGTGYSQQTMDAVAKERDAANRAYHAEFDKRQGIRAWWHKHVRVEGNQLATNHEGLEELRKLIADWSFDAAVGLRSKDEQIERLKTELEQIRERVYKCPVFPGKNQDGGS